MEAKELYQLPREERGQVMLNEGLNPKVKQEQVYAVPSQFSENKKYQVIQNCDGWICNCMDNKYRRHLVGDCKHIHLVRIWAGLREYLTHEGIYEGTEKVLPTCAYCNSLQVVRNGRRENKQRFKCETCGKTFVANPEFKGLKADAKTIVLCIDLYLKGLSLRKIKDTVWQFQKISVTHETVRQWKNRFMNQINDYVATLKPELKGHWHTDETKVKTKKGWLWVWNSLDEESRFLLASTISKDRSILDARKHFREAKRNNSDARPEIITTDGLHAYHKAITKEFKTVKKETAHKRSVGFYKNQHIERLNGNQKERIKVMRGLANRKSLTRHANDYRTFYNFVRPHQALNGETPAEKAGIKIELGQNKWASLIKKASQNEA